MKINTAHNGYNLLIVVFILLVMISCSCFSRLNKKAGLKDDNVIEEIVEKIIEENFYIDVDLTPKSKE